MTDTKPTYTPTQELILEVLQARYRGGENSWSFSSRLEPRMKELAQKGLIHYKSAIVENALLVWFTDSGKAEFLTTEYVYPAVREALEKSNFSNTEVPKRTKKDKKKATGNAKVSKKDKLKKKKKK